MWPFSSPRLRVTEDDLRNIRIDAALEAISLVVDAARELPALTAESPRPELIVNRPEWRAPELIWRVPLRDRDPVYMAAYPAPAGREYDERRHVVLVSIREFYGAWRAADVAFYGEGARACSPRDITSDRKWKDQGPNWEGGMEHPVPLPNVGFHHRMGIRFGDGITRSLWLAHHGATSLPVLVYDPESAYRLHEYVGDPFSPPRSIYELLQSDGQSTFASCPDAVTPAGVAADREASSN